MNESRDHCDAASALHLDRISVLFKCLLGKPDYLFRATEMNPLEQRLRYKFRNPLLLAEALTHPSLGHETQRHHFDNQRLEFFGDSVVNLAVADRLWRRYPDVPEGFLTKVRARLVHEEGLALVARRIPLGDLLLLGRGEDKYKGREKNSLDASTTRFGCFGHSGRRCPCTVSFVQTWK